MPGFIGEKECNKVIARKECPSVRRMFVHLRGVRMGV